MSQKTLWVPLTAAVLIAASTGCSDEPDDSDTTTSSGQGGGSTSSTGVGGGSSTGAGGGGANQPPVASFTMDPDCTMSSTEEVTFTSTSTDPDGDPLTCDWIFSSGVPATSTDCVTTGVTFPNVAPYTVILTVSDGQATAEATMQISPCP